MAVQAQHPSNVLLLNRGVQEGKDLIGDGYLLHPQPGGFGFLDQSPLLLNNGVDSNPRKREKLAPTTAKAPMNQLNTMQAQPSQFVGRIHSSQPTNVISTGLRLSLADQQQQQQQLMPKRRPSPESSVLLSLLSEDLSSQLTQQKDEIEQFLKAQGEQLRRTLAEKRRRHYTTLLGAAEESLVKRLKQKEREKEEAARLRAELEARAARLSAEVQAWQARARAQEATAAALQSQLQQAVMSAGWAAPEQKPEREYGGGGAGCSVGDVAEDAESAYVDPERTAAAAGPCCRACRKRAATVVLLPCRHLCLCTRCDDVAQACPLCLTPRSNSLEVFLC